MANQATYELLLDGEPYRFHDENFNSRIVHSSLAELHEAVDAFFSKEYPVDEDDSKEPPRVVCIRRTIFGSPRESSTP